MKIKVLLTVLLSIGSLHCAAMEVDVIAPSEWGKVKMHRSSDRFSLSINGAEKDIENHMVDPMLRKMNAAQMAAFLSNGYVSAKRMSDGSYGLDAKGRIKGGGPITAATLYWITKIGCYGTAAAATGSIAVVTAGTGLAAAGGLASAAAATTVVSGAGIAAPIAGLVAGAVGNAALAEATLVTAGVVTSAGGIAGAVAVVESASLGAFAFGMMLPLP